MAFRGGLTSNLARRGKGGLRVLGLRERRVCVLGDASVGEDFPPSRHAALAEAVALCEAAQEQLERILAELQKAIAEGRRLTRSAYQEEDNARKALYESRLRLSERLRLRRQLASKSGRTNNDSADNEGSR